VGSDDRDEQHRLAAVPPTAARWVVLGDGGTVAVDVVAQLLRLHPRTRLRSREGEVLRALAAAVEQLVGAGAVCPSGTPLLDVLVTDEATKETVRPTFDLEALLAGEEPERRATDRVIRLAGAMVERAAAHRAGEVDIVTAVAPPGRGRHALADEVDALVTVAVEGWQLPADPAPAITTVEHGWLGASPFELFLVAGRDLARGEVRAAVGEAIARWFDGVVRGPDPWRQPLMDRVPVDADGLLHDAAAAAGSDHPRVLGSVLVDLVAARHPLG
jgi:hypothetical protein